MPEAKKIYIIISKANKKLFDYNEHLSIKIVCYSAKKDGVKAICKSAMSRSSVSLLGKNT